MDWIFGIVDFLTAGLSNDILNEVLEYFEKKEKEKMALQEKNEARSKENKSN